MTQCLRTIPSASVSETLAAYERFAAASSRQIATTREIIRRLRHQDGRPRGLATFHVPVRLCGVLQRIFLIDRDFHRAGTDNLEQIGRHCHQVLALGSVMVERRARCEKRTLGLQDIDIEGVDLPRRAAEAYEIAKRPKAIE